MPGKGNCKGNKKSLKIDTASYQQVVENSQYPGFPFLHIIFQADLHVLQTPLVSNLFPS